MPSLDHTDTARGRHTHLALEHGVRVQKQAVMTDSWVVLQLAHSLAMQTCSRSAELTLPMYP